MPHDLQLPSLDLKALVALLSLALSALALLVGPAVVRRRRVALAAFHAFNIVEDVAAECRASHKAFPFLDKARAGLSYANEWMVANGWRPLKPGEERRAQLAFKSIHGARKAAPAPGAVVGLFALLLLPVVASSSGCALFRGPTAPLPAVGISECEAWRLAELTWAATSLAIQHQVEASRVQACTLPPVLPAPAEPPVPIPASMP